MGNIKLKIYSELELDSMDLSIEDIDALLSYYNSLYEDDSTNNELKDKLYDLINDLEARFSIIQEVKENSSLKDYLIQDLQRENERLKHQIELLKEESTIDKMLTKNDIKEIFKKEDTFALNILKYMTQIGLGIQINKEYFCTREQFREFLAKYKGNNLKI